MAPPRVETGNTFSGFIHEFSGVRVDNFDNEINPIKPRQPVEFYLLTHAHADHLKGLESKSFSGKRIYCSTLTKELLLADPKYKHKKPYLEALDCNVDLEIPYKDTHLTLVLIPSNHCPGSVMFLLSDKTSEKNVLLTGDIRAEQRWIETIIKNPYLYPFTTKLKHLDNIYLDTTYGYRQEPFIIMPKNSEGLNKLTNILADYPTEDEDIHFYFPDSNLGFEEVWSLVLPMFTDSAHITKPVLDKLEKIFEYDQECCYSTKFQNMFNLNDSGSNFHVCNRPVRTEHNIFNVIVKPVINVDKETYAKMNAIPQESELQFAYETERGHKVYKRNYINAYGNNMDSYHLKHKDTGIILNDTIAYFFSRHSSYDECLNFVSQFNVRQIYPTTESKISWSSGFQVSRHFGKLLTGTEFLYDQNATKTYGPRPLLSQDPTIVDMLTNNEFNGVELLTAYKQKSFGLDFKGQQPLKSAFGEDNLSDEVQQANYAYKQSKQYNHIIAGANQYRYQKLHDSDPEKFRQKLLEKGQRYNAGDREGSYNDQETDVEDSSLDEKQFEFVLSPIKKKKRSLDEDNLQESLPVLKPRRDTKKRKMENMMKLFYNAKLTDLDKVTSPRISKERIKEIELGITEKNGFSITLTSLVEYPTQNHSH
ncbi:hypothetical protein WICPIJ_008650 [Wickerhamomyces pijperi]|uniref:Metallo-beta-lactamase domain-containing protein n=1 Tax=Wickerhamomyces pijperi TaxID=599730 RepID=A0A9P8THW9_WICPI|nr:hypothetical protein WICPIJ_008650 [Wickerhamomyces pijperi]